MRFILFYIGVLFWVVVIFSNINHRTPGVVVKESKKNQVEGGLSSIPGVWESEQEMGFTQDIGENEAFILIQRPKQTRAQTLLSRGYNQRSLPLIKGMPMEILDIEKEPEKENKRNNNQKKEDNSKTQEATYPIPEDLNPIPVYDPYIDQRVDYHAANNEVDADLIRAVIMQESVFDPDCKYGSAYGLMQLEYLCCKEMGVEYPCTDIDRNIFAGTGYLKKQLDRFGDIEIALAAYNWGPTIIQQYVDHYGKDYDSISRSKGFRPITREYVKRVLGYYMVFKGQK